MSKDKPKKKKTDGKQKSSKKDDVKKSAKLSKDKKDKSIKGKTKDKREKKDKDLKKGKKSGSSQKTRTVNVTAPDLDLSKRTKKPKKPGKDKAPKIQESSAEYMPATESEPTAGSKALPSLWIGILAAMLFWGDMYVMNNGGDLMGEGGNFPHQVYYPVGNYAQLAALNPEPDLGLFGRGKIAYGIYCVVCHQVNGKGTPGQFPPLAESEWVLTEGPNRLIRILLDGLSGPITVKGEVYNNAMVPWRGTITDDNEIAAILTYIRQEWGNTGSDVSPEKVTEIRESTISRVGRPWTAPELLAIPDSD